MYKYYNPNPAGNMVRDCVVRAISKAEDQSWDKSYWGICISGFVYKDMPDANKSWGKYLQSLGYKRGTLPNTCPDCYTVKEFCQDYPQGTYVVCTGNHAVAAVDEYFNVSRAISAQIWKDCCETVAVRNTSDIPINVVNANIIISRPDLAVTR